MDETTNRPQQYMPALTVGDYLLILKRRFWAMIIPFSLILTAGILLAYLLPSIYRSEATVLIERQEIPTELVETTVTGFVQERIEGLNKTLLTRDNLWEIAEKLDLYADTRSPENRSDIETQMKDAISVEMVDVKTTDAGGSRQGSATVAFTVSFESTIPEEAKKVANEIASLYVTQNEILRSKHAQDVSEFLQAEGERLSKEITKYEEEISLFKQKQRDQLPELMNLNLQLFEKTENEIERTNEHIRKLDDRVYAIRAELAITKPHKPIVDDSGNRVVSGDERLSILTAEYIRLSSRYAPQHPDVIKLRREIQSMGGEKDVSGVTTLIDKLTMLKVKLEDTRRSYSDNHPDVTALRRSIAAVEKGLQTASGPSVRSNAPASAPDNPQYVSLTTQLDSTLGNLKSEKEKLAQLNTKLEEYESRLFKTPAVERDYKLLSRDYDNARKKYNEIKNKQAEARLAIDLESSNKSERFTIAQRAYLPSTPESPNRLGIALLSFLLASGAGILMIAIKEYLDSTIYNVRDLRTVFPAPPLVTIPYIPEPS